MSSRSAALATLSLQVESFSQLAQKMQALAQALQSQLSTVATPSPALPFLAPVMPPSFPVPLAPPTPSKPWQKAKRARRQPPDFTPFGQSLSSLFPGVAHLLTPPEVRPPPNPLPAWFRPHLFCMFHRCVGHSTDNCFALRNAVQDLIDAGTIMIPIAAQSPLPTSAVQLSQGQQLWPRCRPRQYTPLAESLSAIFPLVQPLLRGPAPHPSPNPVSEWYDAATYPSVPPLVPSLDILPDKPMHHIALAQQRSQPRKGRRRRIVNGYTPLARSLSVIFPLVAPFLRLPETRPPPNPLPPWYDASLYCSYHRSTGHSTDGCYTLRDIIQV